MRKRFGNGSVSDETLLRNGINRRLKPFSQSAQEALTRILKSSSIRPGPDLLDAVLLKLELQEGLTVSAVQNLASRTADHQFPVGTRCFSSSNQFRTTLIWVRAFCGWSETVVITKRCPSGVTS